ncbi:unnamed protein product [Phytomonas sp. Hart1]|nr:unnamed protein product [Phytomonas sp. Hart1]|eukprot:CCW71503.1 unnamed protein product [Phytomonas sp. isolate Hart1]
MSSWEKSTMNPPKNTPATSKSAVKKPFKELHVGKGDNHDSSSPRDNDKSKPFRKNFSNSEKKFTKPQEKREEDSNSANRPVIHYKKDIKAGSTWSKSRAGPSFADMVRQQKDEARLSAEAITLNSTLEAAQPLSQDENTPAALVTVAIQEAIVEQQTVEQPPAQLTAAESKKVSEPVAPPTPPAPSYYVLEVERVDCVKLPINVVKVASMSAEVYNFSAHAGKAPTPPAPQQPQAIYRSDTANLSNRTWSLADTGRLLPQQHHSTWQSSVNQTLDGWNNAPERTNLVQSQSHQQQPQLQSQQRFQQVASHMQYNAYHLSQSQLQQQQQIRSQNFFPPRLRASELTDFAPVRQPVSTTAPFSRAQAPTSSGISW